jgi:hypothetical protein
MMKPGGPFKPSFGLSGAFAPAFEFALAFGICSCFWNLLLLLEFAPAFELILILFLRCHSERSEESQRGSNHLCRFKGLPSGELICPTSAERVAHIRLPLANVGLLEYPGLLQNLEL